MRLFPKMFSKKAGVSPGTLVHVGEKKAEKTVIRKIYYDAHTLEEKELETVEESFSQMDAGVTWINIDGLHEMDIIEKRGSFYNYNDSRLAQGRENTKEYLRDNPELAEEIEFRIRESIMPDTLMPLDDDEDSLEE